MISGLQCWDVEGTGVDINEELANVASAAPPGDEGTNGKYCIFSFSSFHRYIGNERYEIVVNPKYMFMAPSHQM